MCKNDVYFIIISDVAAYLYLQLFLIFKTIIVKITADQYQIMWCAYCVFVCALFPVQEGIWTEYVLSG